MRNKRTKAAAAKQTSDSASKTAPLTKEQLAALEKKLNNVRDMEDDDDENRPWTDKEFAAAKLPVVNWYEQDLDRITPRRLVQRLETTEDWKRNQETHNMMVESQNNPDYDTAELNKRLLDNLISNPNFADLADELRAMKNNIKTKEEIRAIETAATKEAEPDLQELNASLRMGAHEIFQNLIDDPDFSGAKAELREVVENMPEMEEFNSPDFQDILAKAMAKIDQDPIMQKKMEALARGAADPKFEKDLDEFQKVSTELVSDEGNESEQSLTDIEDVDQLLYQMRDILKSMGGDRELEAELDSVLNEDPTPVHDNENSVQLDREMDPEELAIEIKKLTKSKVALPKDEEENIPASLQAKVDKIMEDPKLMEKLMYVQKLIQEQNRADPTSILHNTAPDPYELDESRTVTLKERMAAVRRNPEHLKALQRLRVKLPPPFNISPALKSFNQSIELAYVGANDDVRRILWRAYQKARVLPTFLQNISDDAWDILYYSQAVTWRSNQNRQAHLRMLLEDLKSLGRDGPPTHPSTLVRDADAEQLDTKADY